MYKMLIVDDEYLVRTGIRQTIDWASLGIQIVGEAVNGKEGIAKVCEHKPDVIITDIKMPVVDGIEFTKHLSKINYDGAVVVLSGFNNFAYAKAAFESGIYSYLLKPIDNAELIDCVLSAVEKLKEKRSSQKLIENYKSDFPRVRQQVISDWIHGVFQDTLSDEELLEKLEIYDINAVACGIVIYCKVSSRNTEICHSDCLTALNDAICNSLSAYIVHSDIDGKRLCIVTDACDIACVEDMLWQVLKVFEKKFDAVISIGISNIFDSAVQVPTAFNTAKIVALNQLFETLSSISAHTNAKGKFYKKQVGDALQIIAQDFGSQDMSVASVAEKLGVSQSYLMHLFKDEVAKTFNTCVTEYRINMAKKYLLTHKYRVGEIAEMVGYTDFKYFGQVFRKLVGTTPSEYVKKNERKEP